MQTIRYRDARQFRNEPEAAAILKMTRTSSLKRFGAYKPETGQEARQAELRSNAHIERILAAWEMILCTDITNNQELVKGFVELYNEISKAMVGIRCDEQEIQAFLVMLPGLIDAYGRHDYGVDYKYSAFISALINHCVAEKISITIPEELEGPLLCLGHENEGREIEIFGDGGHKVGNRMSAGRIIVHGDANWIVGPLMSGGELIIEGYSGNYLGAYMSGGRIIAKNGCGKSIGEYMVGGELHINGAMGEISKHLIYGKIYHEGKLIVDK